MSAQVAIAANYFPAYARLPRKAQRKADEFIRKFRLDPKQASIHYEPIVSASDKQLRSVRVGDDYRAIVRAPEQGDLFILLYVDHHDEAYRWAEGKLLQVHPATGTLQFFDVDEVSAAVTSLDAHEAEPVGGRQVYEERRLFSDFSDDQLFVGGVPRALLPAVRALYTDADLDRLVEHLPREAADLLTGLAAGYDYDELLEQIVDKLPTEAPKSSREVPQVRLDSAEMPQVEVAVSQSIEVALQKESSQAQFRMLDEDFDLEKALSHPLDVWRVYLHPSQKQIVRARTKGPLRITGGAGTGKTVVAMHRAAYLLKHVFTAPDDRILVTTFTKNLARDIHSNLETLLEPEELTRIEVTNIDAWAADYLKRQGHPLRLATRKDQTEAWTSAFDLYGVDGFDLDFCRAEWDAVIQEQGLLTEEAYVRAVRHHRGVPLGRAHRRKLWLLFSEYRSALEAAGVSEAIDIMRAARERLTASQSPPPYRSVIVDETQDLSSEALRLVRTLAGPEGPNDLLLVGDSHQRIYGRPTSLSACGIHIRGRRSRELRLNYRTTAAICRWSLRSLGTGEFDDLDGGKATTRGHVSLRQGAPPLVQHFEHKAQERAFVVEKVKELLKSGVLPEEICVVARTKHFLTGGYQAALEAAGVECEVLDREKPRSASVRLATMHRVKGLEFPVVFVVAVNDGIVPLSTSDLNSEDALVAARAELQERCLLYVATSRARDQLFVTSYERQSPFVAAMATQEAPVRARSEPPAEKVAHKPWTPVPLPPAWALVPEGEENPALAAPLWIDREQQPISRPANAVPLPATLAPLPAAFAEWRLPTRMLNWLQRNRVETVEELIALDPQALLKEKNLGRKSVADTAAVIEAKLGASWQQLRGNLPQLLRANAIEEVAPELGPVLATVLSELELPEPLLMWAADHGVHTLRDLAAHHPLQLVQDPALDRVTVGAARAVLESKLGRRWEEAQRQLSIGALDGDIPWDRLKNALPAVILSHSLGEVALPTRMRGFATREGIETIGALVDVDRDSLVAEDNLGPTSLASTARMLLEYSETVEQRIRKWQLGFLPALKEMFSELDTIPRMIMSRRAGLGNPPETLEEIGSTFGVSRERIRQIEKKTWDDLSRSQAWCQFVLDKCQAAAPGGAVSLERLDEDSWWTALSDEPEALDYFCDRLLEGKWRVVQLGDEQYLATTTQKELDDVRANVRKVVKQLKLPVALSLVRSAIEHDIAPLGDSLRQLVWEEIEEQLNLDGEGSDAKVLAFGSSKAAQVIAFLERQPRPVPIAELTAKVGRCPLPDDVFLLARGQVGLERHFLDFKRWRAEIAPVAIRLIEEHGPERQWSCTDLLASVRDELELPEWLSHWHLAAILRRSEGIEYLGRLRVALPGAIEDSTRIHVNDALEQLMKAAGKPISWEAVSSGLRAKLDVTDIALVGLLNRPPFLKVAKRTFGLLARDLPGGFDAMTEALDELEAVLERRQRGLSAKFVHKELSGLSATHAEWSQEISLSVVRADPRFRLTISGNVGLAAWDSVRVPSKLDVVQEALEKSGARVSIAAIQDRIDSLYGARPERVQLGLLANRFGARLDGEWIVRESADTRGPA